MALANISINVLDPTVTSLAAVSIQAPLSAEQSKGYSTLWNLLTGKEWNPTLNPVLSLSGGKAYLPKMYRDDAGNPFLIWGGERMGIPASDQLKYSYTTYSTGYSSPHVAFIFTDEKTLKGSKNTFQAMFPVALIFGDERVPAEFLGLVSVNEQDAFLSYVQKPNPTLGLRFLDEAVDVDGGELVVKVLDAVTLKGAEEYGGKPYTLVTVKMPGNPETFKLRTNQLTSSQLQGPLKFPLNVDGLVAKAKKNLNLKDMKLTIENFDKSKLG